MKDSQKIQEVFLDRVIREEMQMVLFLMNGYQLRGVITGYDDSVVVIETDGKQQVVYKHAISTMVPPEEIEEIRR